MKEEDKLLEGNYDGIEEYDNDLPRWWVWLFYLTIVFAVMYPIYYHVYPGRTTAVELAEGMKDLEVRKAAIEAQANAMGFHRNEEALIALSKDPEHVEKGKVIFATRCAVCHGPEGQGIIGPNLTDDYWIHGSKLEQLRTVIENGVLEKGMLAWKGILSSEDIDNVLSFIRSIHGTNPANPKAPQGDLATP